MPSKNSLAVFTDGRTEVSSEVLENLAKGEHLRYSRYLSAHGYVFADVDDDAFKTSHQICSWADLTDADREYHINMVRAQLKVLESGELS